MKPTRALIKPIETVYNGHRFRSRLEARAAEWFEYGENGGRGVAI